MDPLGFISICINAVLIVVGLVLWMAAPPSAKILLLKKLGFHKAQDLNLVADRDRVMQLEVQDVRSDGMLEGRKVRSGMKTSFYLGRVKRDSANHDQNALNKSLENDILPPYSLDGVPIYLSYIGTAFATNPAVLTALRLKDKVSSLAGNSFDAEMMLPEAITVDNEKVDSIETKVYLPFDPKDIAKALPEEFAQIDVGETKVRSRLEGEASKSQDGMTMFKTLLIVGLIACIGLAIAGAVGTHLFG